MRASGADRCSGRHAELDVGDASFSDSAAGTNRPSVARTLQSGLRAASGDGLISYPGGSSEPTRYRGFGTPLEASARPGRAGASTRPGPNGRWNAIADQAWKLSVSGMQGLAVAYSRSARRDRGAGRRSRRLSATVPWGHGVMPLVPSDQRGCVPSPRSAPASGAGRSRDERRPR